MTCTQHTARVSFKTSFDSKQPKLEPKLVSALSVVLLLYRNREFRCFDWTETNQNFLFLVSRNKPKQTRNRSWFGLFRFEPKFIFVCFEDTLHTANAFYVFDLFKILLEDPRILKILFSGNQGDIRMWRSSPRSKWEREGNESSSGGGRGYQIDVVYLLADH